MAYFPTILWVNPAVQLETRFWGTIVLGFSMGRGSGGSKGVKEPPSFFRSHFTLAKSASTSIAARAIASPKTPNESKGAQGMFSSSKHEQQQQQQQLDISPDDMSTSKAIRSRKSDQNTAVLCCAVLCCAVR